MSFVSNIRFNLNPCFIILHWKEPLALQFQDLFNWMLFLGVQYGYLGVFGVSLVGAVSILFPVPDSLVVFTVSGLRTGETWMFEPVFIAAVAGIGSALGEFSGYLLGFTGRKAITKSCKKNMISSQRSSIDLGRLPFSCLRLRPCLMTWFSFP